MRCTRSSAPSWPSSAICPSSSRRAQFAPPPSNRRDGCLAAESLDRLVAIGQDRDRLVQAGELEQSLHLIVGATENQALGSAVAVLHGLPAGYQHRESGRVDELAIGEIDQDGVGAVLDRRLQGMVKLGRG